MFESLVGTLTKVAGTVTMHLKDKAPEILTATGIVGVVASGVLACKATLQLEEVLEETTENLALRDKAREKNPIKYDEDAYQRDTLIIYGRAVVSVAKLYAPTIILGVASIACLIGSARIMRGRNVALAAAYKALDTSFRRYRARVAAEHGEQTDKDYARGVHNVKVIDEDGNETGETQRVVKPEHGSVYSRLYDETLITWRKTHDERMQFLLHTQAMMNQRLRMRGFVSLNEVYEALGLEWSKAGQEVGWVHDIKHGDGYIDFGLHADRGPEVRDFITGAWDAVWLDFNVDGPIKYMFYDYRTNRENRALEDSGREYRAVTE